MKTETFAIVTALVVLSVSLLTMNLAHPVMADNTNRKCISEKSKDSDTWIVSCVEDNQAANAAKKLCQQTTDNKERVCSSSQTANGNNINQD